MGCAPFFCFVSLIVFVSAGARFDSSSWIQRNFAAVATTAFYSAAANL
jgi:hypothetical protein